MQTKIILKQPSALKLRFQPGATGPAGTITVGTVTTGAPGSSVIVTNSGTPENAILNFTIPEGEQGIQGLTGNKGWSPAFAIVTDGARRVLQVDDWVGGEGVKPATGDYVGATGLTPTIGDAVDIRGPAGTATIPDGDKGDITTSAGGDAWTINAGAVDVSKLPPAFDTVKLPAIRRLLRNVPDLYDWGGSPGAGDNTGAWNAALLDLRTNYPREGTLFVPPGDWVFATQQNPVEHGIAIEGAGIGDTVMYIQHGGTGVKFTGRYGTEPALRRLTIGFGTTDGAIGVHAESDQMGWSPDFLRLEDVNVTGFNGTTVAYAILLDGSARPTVLFTGACSNDASPVYTFSGAAWAADEWANGRLVCRVTTGAAAGQTRLIVANTATTLTLESAFSTGIFGQTCVIESSLHGLRNVRCTNIGGFNATSMFFEGRHLRDFRITDLAANVGDGSTANCYIRGKNSTYPSTDCEVRGANCGQFTWETTSRVLFTGMPSTLSIASTVNNLRANVPPLTTISNSGTDTSIN